jgi:hypothetical protein
MANAFKVWKTGTTHRDSPSCCCCDCWTLPGGSGKRRTSVTKKKRHRASQVWHGVQHLRVSITCGICVVARHATHIPTWHKTDAAQCRTSNLIYKRQRLSIFYTSQNEEERKKDLYLAGTRASIGRAWHATCFSVSPVSRHTHTHTQTARVSRSTATTFPSLLQEITIPEWIIIQIKERKRVWQPWRDKSERAGEEPLWVRYWFSARE